MILFNGHQFAQQKEEILAKKVRQLTTQINQLTSQPANQPTKLPHIAAVLFTEDAGSVLYTQKKSEAASRCGIGYSKFSFSISDPVEKVIEQIHQLNTDDSITGIIIQKPMRKTWESNQQSNQSSDQLTNYPTWWHTLTSSLDEAKDVDGLHPNTIKAIKNNTWRQQKKVLPATCKAVLSILEFANTQLTTDSQQLINQSTAIIGKSDLLGYPLFYELKNRGNQNVQLFGKKELQQRIDSGQGLKDFQVIITATGQPNLISGSLISDLSVLIDAGEPQPDVDRTRVESKAAFLTPVPGGVGPVTIVSLLENSLEIL